MKRNFDEICDRYITEFDLELELTNEQRKRLYINFISEIVSHYINKNVLDELYEEEFNMDYEKIKKELEELFKIDNK